MAHRLADRGFSRVAVLAGGYRGWESGGYPIEAPPAGELQAPAAPAARPTRTPSVPVDFPVGVRGWKAYFNARATTLGTEGVFLATTELIPVGQDLYLTLHLTGGEPVEAHGQVISVRPRATGGQPQGVAVAFRDLNPEAETLLEGFVLARWTGGAGPGARA